MRLRIIPTPLQWVITAILRYLNLIFWFYFCKSIIEIRGPVEGVCFTDFDLKMFTTNITGPSLN